MAKHSLKINKYILLLFLILTAVINFILAASDCKFLLLLFLIVILCDSSFSSPPCNLMQGDHQTTGWRSQKDASPLMQNHKITYYLIFFNADLTINALFYDLNETYVFCRSLVTNNMN